jgi:hypothetical protein
MRYDEGSRGFDSAARQALPVYRCVLLSHVGQYQRSRFVPAPSTCHPAFKNFSIAAVRASTPISR